MAREQRVLFLYVKSGAGHLRAALALDAACAVQYPDAARLNVDILEYASPAYRGAFSKGYERLAADLPSVWKIIYEQMERKKAASKTKKLTQFISRINTPRLHKVVAEFDPDVIVATHYMAGDILARQRRKGKLRATLSVVLTDYDIHTMWIADGVDRYFVATDEMAYALKTKGVGSAGVSVTGIPIMPVFAQTWPPREAMRRKLGLRVDAPTVLMAAGGFGDTPMEETVGALAREMKEAQILAYAGRQQETAKQLNAVAAAYPDKVKAYGFVDNMHELMAASDLAVTKSGGLTGSECLAVGLPMVIFNPIPGQEERNADHLLESGAAQRANSPAHLVYKSRRILEDPALRRRMSEAARQAARPRAAFDILSEAMAVGKA